MLLAEWTGHPSVLAKNEQELLKPDDYILANYSSENSSPINLYAAYYREQKITKSIHSPSVCLPTSGWIMQETSRIEVPNTIQGGSLPVNRAIIHKNGETRLVYYWFQQSGRSIANPILAKWFLLSDSLMRGRGDSALVRLIVPVLKKDKIENVEFKLQKFFHLIYPHLIKQIPN
jgi:EpsI family protein